MGVAGFMGCVSDPRGGRGLGSRRLVGHPKFWKVHSPRHQSRCLYVKTFYCKSFRDLQRLTRFCTARSSHFAVLVAMLQSFGELSGFVKIVADISLSFFLSNCSRNFAGIARDPLQKVSVFCRNFKTILQQKQDGIDAAKEKKQTRVVW